MSSRLQVTTALAVCAFALIPAGASAHWYPPADGSTPQWQGSDPHRSGPPSEPSWIPSQVDPNPVPQPDPSRGWPPAQGDPPETPQTWNQSPPGGQHTQDPWSGVPALPVSKRPTVAGRTAEIRRNGLAAIPRGAPAKVRAIIAAANAIIGKPYKWGGGHGRLYDTGYDCSGSVSYALIRAGLLDYPMVSGALARWGVKGIGRYVTIYADRSHVYMEVAGLRLDTSSVGDPGGKPGVRWRPPIGRRFGFAVRHIGGL